MGKLKVSKGTKKAGTIKKTVTQPGTSGKQNTVAPKGKK